MSWVKGQSGNPLGRPKQYTAVSEFRDFLHKNKRNLIEEAFECLDKIQDHGHRLNGLLKLMEFVYSKPKEIEVSLAHAITIIRQAIAERDTKTISPGMGDN